jgi:hypothetical protein
MTAYRLYAPFNTQTQYQAWFKTGLICNMARHVIARFEYSASAGS